MKAVTKYEKRHCLVSEPNYHLKKWFSEKVVAIEIRATEVKTIKPVWRGFLVLDLKEVEIYEF